MIPSPLIIGGTIVGLYYMGQSQIGVTQEEHAGTAITIAMQSLLSSRPLAGVSWAQDPALPLSATANYGQMLGAMIGRFGQSSSSTMRIPNTLTSDQLVEIATKWLAAYDAGRIAGRQNFAFTTSEANADSLSSGSWLGGQRNTCAETGESDRTPLGNAACALASYRDQLASGAASTAFTDDGETTQETFRLINALAAEMDGADYTVDGVRASDQGWKWSDIPGGLAAGASASLSFVEGLAGSAANALGGAIVGSDLFWLAGLVVAGYFVLR